MGGLDHIVESGGTITEAVSNMIWPGKAVVHVSVVNWLKGNETGPKRLYTQDGNVLEEGWRFEDLDRIASSLSFDLDVTIAKPLQKNSKGGCYQGQTHGHKAFLVPRDEAIRILRQHPDYKRVLKPFLTSDDLVGEFGSKPTRYVIDFSGMDLLQAQRFSGLYKRIEAAVLPARKKAADEEAKRNAGLDDDKRGNQHHANFLKRWWKMSYPREQLMRSLKDMSRYIVCGQVTKRPIFDFISTNISPNAALTVFTYDDDYTFGVLQSSFHWRWFSERCSTLKSDPRYTTNTVFDSFPWPQTPTLRQAKDVAEAAANLRTTRRRLLVEHQLTLRELYRSLELPGEHPLKESAAALDEAVRAAYDFPKRGNDLAFLLALNLELADQEDDGRDIVGPGLPEVARGKQGFVTGDCITP